MTIGTGHDIIAGIDAQVSGSGPAIYGTQKPYIADPNTGALVANPNYGGQYSTGATGELAPYYGAVTATYNKYMGAGPESQEVQDYWASDLKSGQHYYMQQSGGTMTEQQAFDAALADMHLNFAISDEFQDIVAGGPDRAGNVRFTGGGSTTTVVNNPSTPQTQAMIYGGGGSSGANINMANREAKTAADNFKILKSDPNALAGAGRGMYNQSKQQSSGSKVPGPGVKNTNIPTA
tara:strand:+ start:54 stop:758 length:705 start_codon:yes stop_codon:yes gene_type:complete